MNTLCNITKKFKKRFSLSLVISLLALSLLQGCGSSAETASASPEILPEERTEEPSDLPAPETAAIDTKNSVSEQAASETAAPVSSTIVTPTSSMPLTPSTMKLHLDGTHLADSAGNAVQLKGISTHGIAWFPDYINKDCFRQLRDAWHVNVIRLAMYTSEYGGYCNGGNQAQLKNLMKNGVEYASALDMYVIIDWHILSDGNPNTHKEEAKAFFAEMAKLYADYDNVLYEICNEPNGGTNWQDIKAYAEEVIPVIRSYDKDGIIIVGTPNWSQYADQAAADPVTGYDNIMYALHFYAATHTDSLRNAMVSALESGLPVFVSEYGICDASGNGAIDEYQAEQWISAMDQYGVSYVAWNLSNKAETSAILSSSCNKISGFTEEDLSASGKWLYKMLTGKSANSLMSQTDYSNAETTVSTGSDMIDTSAGSQDHSNLQNDVPAESDILPSNGALSFTAALANSWESENRFFYQYDLTVFNTSDVDCSRWAVDVTFNDIITLSDGWNGDYSISGKTLHITNKDYNGSIPAGGSTGNIGFIISAGNKLEIIP